jgi:hypothetical protein
MTAPPSSKARRLAEGVADALAVHAAVRQLAAVLDLGRGRKLSQGRGGGGKNPRGCMQVRRVGLIPAFSHPPPFEGEAPYDLVEIHYSPR